MSARRALGWAAVAALLLVPLGGGAQRPGGVLARLLGPVASLAASVEWVRFDAALDAGRPELAYARAARALELDPGAAAGWSYLASHLALGRGSAEAEPDPQRRVAWIRAGVELLERGESRARAGAALAIERGLMLSAVGDGGLAAHWPGGAPACFEAAAQAFAHGAALGDPFGEELAQAARTAAERARAAGRDG